METLNVDPPAIADLTATLRRAVADLPDIDPPATASAGPTAGFGAALSRAIAGANERGRLVREEARRLADVMDLTVEATVAVDSATAHNVRAVAP